MEKDSQELEAELKTKDESYELFKKSVTDQIAKSRKSHEDNVAAMNRAEYLKTNGKAELSKKQDAASADAEVFADIQLQCQQIDTEYAKRQKARAQEQEAVAKA